MTTHGRRASKLEEALSLAKEYQAHLALSGQFTGAMRPGLQKEISLIKSGTNAELDRLLPQMRVRLKELRQALGATQPSTFYTSFLEESAIAPAHFAYVPRWMLEEYFTNISGHLPLRLVPFHAFVQLDVHGLVDDLAPYREYRIMEATLYEDMALMYNRALDLHKARVHFRQTNSALVRPDQKRPLKELATALRATVSATFYFVEAYLNSLAFDAIITKRDTLAPKDLDRVREWDPNRNSGQGAERFLTIRDKCLFYPRILKGVQHPLLDENNCPAMRHFLSEAKDFRDSIVHASPVPNPTTGTAPKEARFLQLELDHCTATVDNAIVMVQSIETAVFGDLDRLSWLVPRAAEGPFPDSALD